MNGTMKKVVLLGSTGIDCMSTLKGSFRFTERIQLIGLAGGRNVSLLREQANAHLSPRISIGEECKMEELSKGLHEGVEVVSGSSGLLRLATLPDADVVLIAIVGTVGLLALAAIRAGKDIAVASKEILVMAGELVGEGGGQTPSSSVGRRLGTPGHFPVSGRQACADVSTRPLVNSFWGPFVPLTSERFENITVDQALKHLSWVMGRKITIDSATMFNKGLEMIEARWLFQCRDGSCASGGPSTKCGSFNGRICRWFDDSSNVDPGHVPAHPVCSDLSGSSSQ